jgi:CHAD domain-containing protein
MSKVDAEELARVVRGQKRHDRAYELRPGEDLARGVRRVARGQIDGIRENLGPDAEGDIAERIHESRKSVKRLRALVRVVRPELGERRYRAENERLRDAGRSLSGVRDAAVMVNTLDDLVERYGDELADDAFAGLRAALVAEAEEAHDRVASDPQATQEVLTTLEELRRRVAAWPIARDADQAVLASGYQRVYRRGRRTLRAACRETDTEHLHDLRKRAKAVWHAAQILRPVAPKKMKRVARRAHDLSDVLGEDHDLAVLATTAREHADALAAGEGAVLDDLVRRRRAKLQRRALKRAERVFHAKPKRAARPVRKAGASA